MAVSQAYVDPSHAEVLINATITTHEAFDHDAVPPVVDHGITNDMAFIAFACAATHDLGHLLDGFVDEAEFLPAKAMSALITLLIDVLASRKPDAAPVRSVSAANVLLAPDGQIWFLALGSDLLTHQGLGLPTAVIDPQLEVPAMANAAAAGLAYLRLRAPLKTNLLARRGWQKILARLDGHSPPFADLDELRRTLRVWWTEADMRPDTVELARLIAETLEPRVAVPATGMMVGGRYRLERNIGYGRRGTVFLGWDTTLEQAVALKWVDHQDEELLARLFREVGILRQIRHPHIVGGFDLVLEPGKRYVAVMEYVPGDSLRELVARKTPVVELLHHLIDIADALDYLQSKGIVHRGIRPANIIIGQRGAVLVDLAIARRSEPGGVQITRDNDRLGAFRYMAPEQTTNKAVTPATDVFAFGRILLDLLTGGDRPLLMTPSVVLGWLREAGAPDALSRVVAQSMSFDPDERPTAAELRATLRLDLSPATQVLELSKFARQHQVNDDPFAMTSRAARRLLVALAEAHGQRVLSIEELFQVGWPAQKAIASAQKNRVYVNLSILRKHGLDGLIDRIDDGYRLEPSLRIVWRAPHSTPPAEAAKN